MRLRFPEVSRELSVIYVCGVVINYSIIRVIVFDPNEEKKTV